MLYRLKTFALAATLLSHHAHSLTPNDIPTDTPISTLLASANRHLAAGETNDALTYYDVAITRDPKNYLTFFKRGATYLSLGRTALAEEDFDRVLSIKPGFEGALLQRAKIKSRNGEWEGAKSDYLAAGRRNEGNEIAELEEAKGAASLAFAAEKDGKWEDCVGQAGVAIMVASKTVSLRQTRARCRFERGEVQEGISDLMHVLQMQPGLTEPHLKIASILYYAMGDAERGLAQVRKCLHSDPEEKRCKGLYRTLKSTDKVLGKVKKSLEKRQFSTAVKPLVASADGEDKGLIAEVREEIRGLKESGLIPKSAPDEFMARLLDMACEAYIEMNSKKGPATCQEALALNPTSKWALISAANTQSLLENYEAAINHLKTALEAHPGDSQLQTLLQKAEVALKRSQTKDYYKILNVPHDADSRQIKAAYRKAVKQHHPDKAHKQGVSKEDAEKKMAGINEAYEVLSDEGLRERFDRGDDPMSAEGQQRGQYGGGNPFANQGGGQQFFQQGSGGQQFKFQFPGGGGFPF